MLASGQEKKPHTDCIRVLHLIDHGGLGGAQSILRDILSHAETRPELDVRVLSLRQVRDEMFSPNCAGYQCLNSPRLTFPVFQLLSIIKTHKIQVIHCHLLRSKLMGALLKFILGSKIRLIWHEHGPVEESPQLLWLCDRIGVSSVDLQIFVSNADRASHLATRTLRSEKTRALLNPGPKVEASKRLPPRLLVPVLKIGFLGRLEFQKGIDFLISASAHFDFPFEIYIAGTGSQEAMLRELVQRFKLEHKVTFQEFQRNVENFTANIDVLVIPSRFEPFGRVALEGMAYGVPVLASNVGGLKEIINDGVNGMLFESLDADDLGIKLKKVYKRNVPVEEIIRNGLLTSEAMSVESYCSDLQKLYAELCLTSQ